MQTPRLNKHVAAIQTGTLQLCSIWCLHLRGSVAEQIAKSKMCILLTDMVVVIVTDSSLIPGVAVCKREVPS